MPRRATPFLGVRKIHLVILPLVFGVVLRFYHLGKQSLFLDEAFSADLVIRPWGEMIYMAFQDVHPVVYYFFLKLVTSVLPISEISLRLFSASVSAFALIVAIYLTYRIARARASFILACLLAWSSLHIYYAQEARMYAMFDLLWLLAPWSLYQALKNDSWKWWSVWVFFSSLAIHTHFFGLLLWGAGAVFSLVYITYDFNRKRSIMWFVSQTLIGLMALLLLSLFFATVGKGVGGTWIPGGMDLIKFILLSLFGFTTVPEQFLYGKLLLVPPWRDIPFNVWLTLLALIFTGTVIGWIRLIRRTGFTLPYWLVFVFGIIPPVFTIILLAMIKQPFWAPRPMIGAATWLLIGVAIGWSEWPKPVGFVLVAMLMVLNFGSIHAYETQWVKDYAQPAFQSIDLISKQPTVLVLDRYYLAPLWNFYHPDDPSITVFGIAPNDSGLYKIKQLVPGSSLRGSFLDVNCNEFPQVQVWLYDPSERVEREFDQWPICILDQVHKIFDPVTLRWKTVSEFP